MLGNDDRVPMAAYAHIMRRDFVWLVGDTVYTGFFYFNEDEVLDPFDKAYGGDHSQPGEFVIRVSKYNNRFDICLRVAGKEYKFEKTQIHVFKQG